MDQLKKEFNLDDFSYNLVYQYLKLDADQRQTVREISFIMWLNQEVWTKTCSVMYRKRRKNWKRNFRRSKKNRFGIKKRARRLKRPALPIRLPDQQVYLRPSIKFQIIIHCFAICVIDRVNAAAFVFYVFNYH